MFRVCPISRMIPGASRALVRRYPKLVTVSLISLPVSALIAARGFPWFFAWICSISTMVGAVLITICNSFH